MLIARTSNVKLAAGISLSEGEAAVFQPGGAAGARFLGQIRPEDW